MLYHFLYPLHDALVGFNIFRYITFRTFAAMFTSMAIYLVFGRMSINWIKNRQFYQAIRDDGPLSHLKKNTTPTMGGLLLWIGIFFSVLLWARWDNAYIPIVIGVALAFGLLGFIDDYRKVILHDAHGLRARYKFPLQLLIGIAVALLLFNGLDFDTHITIPFLKRAVVDIGWWYIPFAVFLLVGVSNAVNLTDGLDGLVAVPSVMSFFTYGIFSYIAGHAAIAAYLQVPFIPGSGELAVVCGAIAGGCIGFLWFNTHPAEVFMGDVGALPLGAVLALIALITKNELVLMLVGGIFVVETLSVMIQVVSFKLTGKRVFKMAPLHHHFELLGWNEPKVIVRFWIIAFILAILSLTTLKIR